MFKNIKISIIALILIAGFSIFISGCSKKDEIKEAFNMYVDLWSNYKYEDMYDMLSEESKEYIDKETFVERYSNIYDAIDAKNIEFSINNEESRDKKSLEIPFTMKLNTIVGDLEIDEFKLTLANEKSGYKVMWNEGLIFPGMVEGDKVRVESNYAKRGSIFDKNGEPLAMDDEVKSIGVHPSKLENNKMQKIEAMANILDISKEYIEEKLVNVDPEQFIPIVDVLQSNYEILDKIRGIEGVIINNKNSRVYSGKEAFGSLIGYIGPITAEELEKYKESGYNEVSLIGKAGLEQVYEDTLRGYDGAKIYIERGEEEIIIAEKDAVNGKDIKLSIDSALQEKIYSEMGGEKGSATAVNPKTGEVLAMVSSPSYDSNIFVTYKTKSIDKKWRELNGEQFKNRFNDVYSPGSTMKLITAAIGLNEKIISPSDEMDISGLSWQADSSWGNYKITRVTDPKRPINLKEAVKYSDNIYFGKLALDIGEKNFISGSNNFGIGEKNDFEFPMEDSKISNDGNLSNNILLADSGYGQGEIMVSTLDMALAYSTLANNGVIMKPRLDLELNPSESEWKNAIKAENVQPLIEAFTSVVNDSDGTASSAKIEGHNIAAKTGTAEIKSNQGEAGIENGWFTAVDIDNSKISISMLIENVQGRGGSGIPTNMIKNILDYYLNR